MPITRDPLTDHVRMTLVDRVSAAEFKKSLLEMIDEAGGHSPKLFIDASRAILTDLTSSELRLLSQKAAGLLKDIYPVIPVVAPTPLHFGIARMLGAHLSYQGINLVIFKDSDEALRFVEGSVRPTTDAGSNRDSSGKD